MPKDYNALFKQDPIAFMQKYSVIPADAIGSQGTVIGDLNTVSTPAGHDYELKSMPNTHLEGYLSFIKIPHANGGQTGQIRVSGDYNPDPTKVKAYFLPWQDDKIISMAIPQMPQFGGNSRYFFTAAINGCSVFIKGTQQTPVIYHAGGSTGTKKPQAGARFWQTMMQSHNATQGPVGAEVNKTMYVTDKKDKGLGTEHSRKFKEWLKSDQSGNYLIEDIAPTGCVMGVRTGGLWTFYLQENATITYSSFVQQPGKFFGTKKVPVTGSTRVVVRPMLFREIFPNGNGNAHFNPNLTRTLKA